MKPTNFRSAAEFRAWLKKHHATEAGERRPDTLIEDPANGMMIAPLRRTTRR
jgi:hypothetical protein